MFDLLNIIKALADENRLRVVTALKGRELCVCEITAMLNLAPSTVSKHMAILRMARLVEGRKDGRWMYYRLADDLAPEVAMRALALVHDALADDDRIRRDAELIEKIACESGDETCELKKTS